MIVIRKIYYHLILMIWHFDVDNFLQGGFSNGYFLYTSGTFDINKEGVVSLMKNASLDRETRDRYTFQVSYPLHCSSF